MASVVIRLLAAAYINHHGTITYGIFTGPLVIAIYSWNLNEYFMATYATSIVLNTSKESRSLHIWIVGYHHHTDNSDIPINCIRSISNSTVVPFK